MSPERWRQARQIFEDALDHDPASRETFVRTSCQEDQRLFEEVASMLASYDQTHEGFLDPIIEGVTLTDRLEGRTLGPYRILHRLGQGGMGAVYLAERADDQFRRRVAVKLVRPGYDDGHLLRRFSNERQLLAVLDHPNIVKLLDAGVTGDGIPYFVMDYVEGQPIDKYCQTRGLSIPERLALFREVCAAVHCAHRNLVVHRDLKPSNILVTPDGAPKLLDFGIAKLLRPEYSSGAIGLTRTTQPMTLEYASPEQVTGQPITTSSDVYSLGVLLYRLIAGKHPYEMNTSSAAEAERTICETNPERPSAVTKAQAGRKRAVTSDVDNIVLMAMRKEPQRRYASAEHLSEDIRRYLENLPVNARKDTVLYRASKFIRRHRAGVAAATLAVVALISTASYAWHEKRIAEHQSADLQGFLTLLFDVTSAMRNKGLTHTRKLMIDKVLEEWDRRAREVGSDEQLKIQAAKGFMTFGDLLGNPLTENLGDVEGARQSYLRELAMGNSMKPGPDADIVMARSNVAIGRLDEFSGQIPAAEGHFKTAMGFYEGAGKSLEARHGLLVLTQEFGRMEEQKGDFAEASRYYSKSLQEARETAKPVDLQRQSLLLGLALARTGRFDEALRTIDDALKIAQVKPRDVASAYGSRGFVLALAGRTNEALDAYQKSVDIDEQIATDDPGNQQARMDLGQMKGEMAGVLWTADRKPEAMRATEKALELLKDVVDKPNALAISLQPYAEFLLSPSNQHPDPAAALRYAQRADQLTHHSNPETLETLAHAYFAAGDKTRSRETAQKTLALMPAGGDSRVRKELEGLAKATPQ